MLRAHLVVLLTHWLSVVRAGATAVLGRSPTRRQRPPLTRTSLSKSLRFLRSDDKRKATGGDRGGFVVIVVAVIVGSGLRVVDELGWDGVVHDGERDEPLVVV